MVPLRQAGKEGGMKMIIEFKMDTNTAVILFVCLGVIVSLGIVQILYSHCGCMINNPVG